MKTGDYVLIVGGVDDVYDGQLCKVMSPDENNSHHHYDPLDWVCVLCWTGYLAWTSQDNLVPITGKNQKLEKLFEAGKVKTGSGQILF